jgi:hypothetical protein
MPEKKIFIWSPTAQAELCIFRSLPITITVGCRWETVDSRNDYRHQIGTERPPKQSALAHQRRMKTRASGWCVLMNDGRVFPIPNPRLLPPPCWRRAGLSDATRLKGFLKSAVE